MYKSSGTNPGKAAKYHMPAFISIIVSGYALSFIIFPQIWANNNHLLHSTIEILDISLMLFTFISIWHSYKDISSLTQWIGFGALIMVFLNLPHVVNLTNSIYMSKDTVDSPMSISLKYGVITGYYEILLWLVFGFFRKGRKLNKWIGLLLSLSISVFFLTAAVKIIDFFPEFYKDFHTTAAKHTADFMMFIVAIVALALYVLKFAKITEEREKVIYEYIIIALSFFSLARIYFALSRDTKEPMFLLAHIFSIAYRYLVYYGIYKTTIEYPYKQIRRVKDFYERLLDNTPFGIITVDHEGKISYANRQCDSLFNYDMQKLYGMTIEQFIDSIVLYNSSKPELLEKINDNFTFYGVPTIAKEGTGKLIFSAVKLETGIVFVVRDAKKEQAIENMQLQTQSLLDSMENVVLLLDINKKVVMCNRKFLKIINTKARDVIGLEVSDLIRLLNTDINGDIQHGDNKAIMKDIRWSFQTPNGDSKKFSLDSSAIYNVDNENIGWIVVGRDISDYEKEQEKIIHNEKMAIIGQMAAGLVHEIKNPLASIKGLCQLMLSKGKSEKITEYAAVMESAVDDINDIVTGFLQFSKPTNGNFQEAYVNNLVKSMEMMISSNGYKNGIKTYFNYSDVEQPVIMNSHQIKNSILGMVDNAIYAMKDAIDPKLIISTEYDKRNNTMNISVKDNGMGMTEEQLSKTGTPFFTTKPRGTGLGVSVIKYILNEHSGTFKIESKLGEGSEFIIGLPCKAAE